MKASFGVLFLSLILSHTVLAGTNIPWTKEGCESVKGIWVTAHAATDSGCDALHCNGKNFCRSQQMTNWFSALIWCKSIGRELTDLETVCPRGVSTMTCDNMAGKNVDGWTTTPYPNSNGQFFIVQNGTIYGGAHGTASNVVRQALCK